MLRIAAAMGVLTQQLAAVSGYSGDMLPLILTNTLILRKKIC